MTAAFTLVLACVSLAKSAGRRGWWSILLAAAVATISVAAWHHEAVKPPVPDADRMMG